MSLLVSDRPGPAGGVVRTFVLSRPERRNALDPALLRALAAAVQDAAADAEVRVLVVTGEGRAFCAGYDLNEPLAGDPPDALVVDTMAAVRALPVPTIARVNGPAFGAGFELAISCDLRVAAADATFCLPPARLGIAYAPGGLARLAALAGTAVARRLCFTGGVMDAAHARAAGLVDELAGPDELDAAVARLADAVAAAAPLAVRAMKRTLDALEGGLTPADRAAAEQDRLICYRSADAAEGLAAFAARRPPRFSGR